LINLFMISLTNIYIHKKKNPMLIPQIEIAASGILTELIYLITCQQTNWMHYHISY